MGKVNPIWIVLGIIAILYLGNNYGTFSFVNGIQIYTQGPFGTDGTAEIANGDIVEKVEVSIEGCSYNEGDTLITLNGKQYNLGPFNECDYLFYSIFPIFSVVPKSQHYQTYKLTVSDPAIRKEEIYFETNIQGDGIINSVNFKVYENENLRELVRGDPVTVPFSNIPNLMPGISAGKCIVYSSTGASQIVYSVPSSWEKMEMEVYMPCADGGSSSFSYNGGGITASYPCSNAGIQTRVIDNPGQFKGQMTLSTSNAFKGSAFCRQDSIKIYPLIRPEITDYVDVDSSGFVETTTTTLPTTTTIPSSTTTTLENEVTTTTTLEDYSSDYTTTTTISDEEDLFEEKEGLSTKEKIAIGLAIVLGAFALFL